MRSIQLNEKRKHNTHSTDDVNVYIILLKLIRGRYDVSPVSKKQQQKKKKNEFCGV